MSSQEPQLSLEEARRRAEEKRRTFGDATEALKTKVDEESGEVRALVAKTKSSLVKVDESVRRYRWLALGAAVAVGVTVGAKRARRARAERLLAEGERAYVVMKTPKKPSLLGSLLRAAAGAAVKEIASRVSDSLQKTDSE